MSISHYCVTAFGTMLLSITPVGGQVALDLPSSAAIATREGMIPKPSVGKGQIIFYRTSSIRGALMGCKIFDNARLLAALDGGRYLAHDIAPGTHVFSSTQSGRRSLEVTVAPDQRRFVKCDFGNGIVSHHAALVLTDHETFAKKANGMRPWSGSHDESERKNGAPLSK